MSKPTLPQSGDYHELLRPVTLKGDEALGYAEKSIPVFPCKPGGKEPLIRKCPVAKRQELTGKELATHARTCERDGHGHHDATTDPERIRRWWSRWPDANVAYPTGKRSGELVMDVDPERGGYDSLAELHEASHELPLTATIKTGGGGVHHRLRYPEGEEIRNSAGKLGPGLDIRGEGGYVIAPPSVTEGPYKVLHNRPLAEAPEWLLEALRGPSRTPDGRVDGQATVSMTTGLEGPEIPAGERNTTLYKIACSLRARGHERGEILEALERVNKKRCSTPLLQEDLSKIAKSAARYAPGNASPEVTADLLEALDAIETDIMCRDWPGVGGKSERDAMVALTWLGRMHGTMIPAGVRLSVDVRTLALMASVSKRSLLDNSKGGGRVPGIISRLKARGVIRSDNATRFGKDAGAFVLLTPRAELHHSTTSYAAIEPRGACGATLRPPLTAPRLRWSRPVFDGLTRVGTISRLGKTKGAVLDYLEAEPFSSLTVAELAEKLGMARVRDLRRRHLEPLAEAGVVECSGDAVSLTADWLDALNERRDQDGEIADHRRDMARYQRERDAYRNRDQNPPTPHPANRGADGYVEDLDILPPTPTVEVLYPLVNTTVNTVRGPGRLWQVFSDRVGVVLEGRPEEVTFMHPSELVLGEVAA
jgi:hypothetical protein